MKRSFSLFMALLLAPLAGHAAVALAATASRPNIILILSDDMGYGDIGAHNCRDIPTPNIDRIARNGVRFTDAYANGSFCTPTRTTLMSGKYNSRNHLVSKGQNASDITFGDVFKNAGYGFSISMRQPGVGYQALTDSVEGT